MQGAQPRRVREPKLEEIQISELPLSHVVLTSTDAGWAVEDFSQSVLPHVAQGTEEKASTKAGSSEPTTDGLF